MTEHTPRWCPVCRTGAGYFREGMYCRECNGTGWLKWLALLPPRASKRQARNRNSFALRIMEGALAQAAAKAKGEDE